MFSATSFDTVGFDSLSENRKVTKDINLQTCDVDVKDSAEQSNEVEDKNIQHEPTNENVTAKYDENRLLHFLNKVTGPLLKELDKVERSKAFTVKRSEHGLLDQEVKELYVLSGQPQTQDAQVKVSSLSWSSTGNVIALSFEMISHEGWCTHESLVCFYNISSYQFDGKVPTHTIQTDSCVTSLAMHPYEPSIVALGTHSGNVEVWSVGKGNRSDGTCLSKDQYHDDKITQVSWAVDSAQQLVLATSSLDGRMSILKVTAVGTTQLVDKYILEPQSPDVLKPGVTCFSFCPKQPGTFVAALESRQLLLCSTLNTKNCSGVVENSPLLRPLDKTVGPISFIKFSPYDDHIFLVATLDFKITLYSIQQDVPLRHMFSDFEIVGADWNPVQENIIVAWGASTKLCVFNQESGERIKEIFPDEESLAKNRKYHKALFNIKSPKLLALAGVEGKSYIWSLPDSV